MVFNLFKKPKTQNDGLPPETQQPESISSASFESAEDNKLLESQIEAIEEETEGRGEGGREESQNTEEQQYAGGAAQEQQDNKEEPISEPSSVVESTSPKQEDPVGLPLAPHDEKPDRVIPGEAVPLPPTSENVQEEANVLSAEFEGGGGSSSLVRAGLIGVLVVIIVGGGVFSYLRFLGGVPSLSFLQNIPFVGTYLGGEETPQPGAPFVPVAPEATSTPSPVSFSEPAPSPVVTSEERDNQRIADIDNLGTQLAAYYAAGGSYPSTGGETEKIISSATELSIYEALVPAYLTILPVDSNPQFYYGYTSDGSSYELTSVLENQDHPECVLAGNYCVRKIRDGEVVSTK